MDEAARAPPGRASVPLWALGFETVSKAAYGGEITRLVRLFFDALAKAAYMHIHRTRSYVLVSPPHLLEELFPAIGVSRVGQEEIEEAEFGGSEVQLTAVAENAVRSAIQPERSGDDFGLLHIRLQTTQMRLDAGQQLARAERLGDIVVAPDLEPQNPVHFLGAGGEEQHGRAAQRPLGAQPAANFEPVLAGQHDVQQNQVRLPGLQVTNRVGAARKDSRREACPAQVVFDERSQVGVVFHNGNTFPHALFESHCNRAVHPRRLVNSLPMLVLFLLFQALTGTPEARENLAIGPDDVLEIQVFQVPELNRTVRVDQKGFITLPLLGAIEAEGLTPASLERHLAKLLGEKYLNNPSVSIFVREFKSNPVSVVGAVKQPGLYQVSGPKPLVEVLAMAGGLADGPGGKAGSRLLVTRSSSQGDAGKTLEVSIHGVLHNQPESGGLLINPGDQVRVLPAEVIYVLGDVEKPGSYSLETHQAVNVVQALALAGGPMRSAKMKQLVIFRHDAAGARTEIPIRINGKLRGPDADRVLAANDILFVPGSVTKRAFGKALELGMYTASGVVIWRR